MSPPGLNRASSTLTLNETHFDDVHHDTDSINSNGSNVELDSLNINYKKDIKDNIYLLPKLMNSKTDLYSILSGADIIVFVSNNKLKREQKSLGYYLKRNKCIVNDNFLGITFLPSEYINVLKSYIAELNINIAKQNLENKNVISNNKECSSCNCSYLRSIA